MLLLQFGVETPAVADWVQPPGFDFCCVFIVDVGVYGRFQEMMMMMSGRNVDFLIINATR